MRRDQVWQRFAHSSTGAFWAVVPTRGKNEKTTDQEKHMRTLGDWLTLLDTCNSIPTVFHTEELRQRFTTEQLKQRAEATIEITTEAGRPALFRIRLVAA